jgi:hypothetical protein
VLQVWHVCWPTQVWQVLMPGQVWHVCWPAQVWQVLMPGQV